jgi:hypothetical protein
MREYLFTAYLIIQHIREILTGDVLSYRLFVTYNFEGAAPQAQFIDIGSESLHNFISYRGNEIIIAENILRKELNNPISNF